jgi:hypothetical protein
MSIENMSDATFQKLLAFIFTPDDDYSEEREAIEDQRNFATLNFGNIDLQTNRTPNGMCEPKNNATDPN